MHLLNIVWLHAFQLASIAAAEYLEHERARSIPPAWSYHGPVNEVENLSLRIYMPIDDAKLQELAYHISDPTDKEYAHHLSHDELTHVLPDTSRSAEHVRSWLKSHSVEDFEADRDWIDFSTDVGTANRMLNTSFSYYKYGDDEPVMLTESYRLPEQISEHVDFIYPTVHFMTIGRRDKRKIEARQHLPPGPINCTQYTCPDDLRSKYHIDYHPKNGSSGSKIGITGFLENFPNVTDWKEFLPKYANVSVPQYDIVSVNGGIQKAGNLIVEPLLDLDYSTAFTEALPVTFYSVGGRPPTLKQPGNKAVPTNKSGNEPYLQFLQHLLAEKNPPQVISISYSDDEETVPLRYAQRVCSLMAQAATRGISIIGSSGDSGAEGSSGDSNCILPNGKRGFTPTFPSSCPWITSVGATAAYGGAASYSAGGISNYFARPTWQSSQVAAYLKQIKGNRVGLFNTTGRGIPDVSLLGDDYLISTSGQLEPADGTSASTPVFAAMIALINDYRLRNGKPVLGHLNPLLYSSSFQSVFRDVKDGSTTRGCQFNDTTVTGWPALKGWDAATGLGEPDFEKLMQAFD